jgi:hypothetical protein
VRRLLLGVLAVVAASGVLVGVAAAASPTIRMAIVHTVSGCHVWKTTKVLTETETIRVKPGTKLEVRASCPMDFDLAQLAGPPLAGMSRLYQGTVRTFVFKRRGTYVIRGTNVQTSEELELRTLGPDHVMTLTVVVR